jgi:hypothetical protein
MGCRKISPRPTLFQLSQNLGLCQPFRGADPLKCLHPGEKVILAPAQRFIDTMFGQNRAELRGPLGPAKRPLCM